MPIAGLGRILLVLLLLASVEASAKDLSKYPCTVFGPDVCFRLPTGTHVDYSVPADFDLYKVSKGDKPVATIYIGNAPQTVEDTQSPRVSKTKFGTIRVYSGGSSSAEKLNIYIAPKAKDGSTVHISADTDPAIRNELIELLSSVRPCEPIQTGGQKCSPNNAWSQELTKGLMP